LLRALTAGWHRSGGENRETFLRLLDALAEPPAFDLPKAFSGHTRHYVPLGGFKNGLPERTLMLDSFLVLERDVEYGTQAFVIWQNVELPRETRRLLERCCSSISYLGRTESWCEINVVDELPSNSGRWYVDLASRAENDGRIVRRLAASPSLRGAGLLRSLSEMTGAMRRARRIMPEGSSWVEYRLPFELKSLEQASKRDLHKDTFPPTILRFAIDSENGVLPPLTKAVIVADAMRKAALSQYSKMSGNTASELLAGKQADGGKRREAHDHPFFLPLDLNNQGFIDAIDVWLPSGCTYDEFRALTSIPKIWENIVLDGTFAVTYLGRVEPERSIRWSTATPIILDRFPKYRKADGSIISDAPEVQIARALERRGLGSAHIKIWEQHETLRHRAGNRTRLDVFRRCRVNERPVYPFVGAVIEFDRPIEGPIILGRLAHFGLGRFKPIL
jgi:CRISPR-associated protein Csb2